MSDLHLAATFGAESDHLTSILERRDEVVAGKIELGVSYLDDCLGGLYPYDLLLIGAATGVGKTDLAITACCAGTQSGKRVYGFFLEAERGEVAQRLYFRRLGDIVRDRSMDYASWARGYHRDYDETYGDRIREEVAEEINGLQTFYKPSGEFSVHELYQQLQAAASTAEMIVLDHVHIVDSEAGKSDRDTLSKVIRLLRDLTLEEGIPVVAVSHLRKKQQGAAAGSILPTIDDFHGASELTKEATQVVLVARDWEAERDAPHLSPTLFAVPKDRKGRASSLVGRCYYNMSAARYERAYEIGKMTWERRAQVWEHMADVRKLPVWAKREARRLRGG